MTEMVQGALSQGHRVAATLPPDTEHPPLEQDWQQNLRYLAWNPRSPLSARAVVTEALNFFESVEDAYIVFSADTAGKAFHELSSTEIEKAVDEEIKGLFFLVKEIFGIYLKQRSGILTFVHHDGGADVLPPLGAAVSGSFRALATALFAQYRNEPVLMRGFQSSVPEVRDFAQFLLGLGADRSGKTSGRWLKFSGRTGFFSFGRK